MITRSVVPLYALQYLDTVLTISPYLPYDIQCLKFKTRSSIILNRFEALNLRLLLAMSARPLPAASSSSTTVSTKPSGGDGRDTLAGANGGEAAGDVVMKDVSTEVPAGSAATGKTAGGKKKKKGKK